jgi:O-antigen ligase
MAIPKGILEKGEKINYLLILLLAFSMPLAFKPLYLSYIIIFLFITWFLQGNFRTRFAWDRIKSNKLLLLLPLFYLLHVIALIYTTDLNDGIKHLEVKATLLLLPIFIIGEKPFNVKESEGILKAFVVGNTVAVLICIIVASIKSVHIDANGFNFNTSIWDDTRNLPFLVLLKNNWSYFSYGSFSIILHPSYFSMYLLFSIGILVYFLHENLGKMLFLINVFLILLFILAIFLLGSRAGILCSAVVMIFFIAAKFISSSRKIIFIPIILLSIISVFFFFSSSRFSIIGKEFSTIDFNGLQTTSNTRIKIWEKSVGQIKEHFLFGVGPGDTRASLNFMNNEHGVDVQLNAHNQYLETFISLGLLGFSLLISILIIPMIIAFRKKNALLTLLLFIISFNALFESVLERAAGVIFYSFFFCFFIKAFHDEE